MFLQQHHQQVKSPVQIIDHHRSPDYISPHRNQPQQQQTTTFSRVNANRQSMLNNEHLYWSSSNSVTPYSYSTNSKLVALFFFHFHFILSYLDLITDNDKNEPFEFFYYNLKHWLSKELSLIKLLFLSLNNKFLNFDKQTSIYFLLYQNRDISIN